MATSFTDTYQYDSDYTLTSRIKDISAISSNPKISVAISCPADGDDDTPAEPFFSTTLYPFDEIATLTDVGSIIEQHFRTTGKVADTVTITFDDARLDIHCLYCEYEMPASFDPTKAHLLASAAQRVHADSILTIAAHNDGDEFIIKIVGKTPDGDIASVSASILRQLDRCLTAHFTVQEIIQLAPSLESVMFFSIEYAGIQKMFYIVPATTYLTFAFRNIFNVREYVDVVGVMTIKPTVERNIALCNGQAIHYDRNVSRTYEMQSEAIPDEELPMFEQLLASHDVAVLIDGQLCPVLITEQTCEPSSDNEKLNTIKFSWRFSGRRPKVYTSAFNGILPTHRGIFDHSFTPEYE